MAIATLSQIDGVRASAEKMLSSPVWEEARRSMDKEHPGKRSTPFNLISSRPSEYYNTFLSPENTRTQVRLSTISDTSFFLEDNDTTTCPTPIQLPIQDRLQGEDNLAFFDDDWEAAITACLDRISNEVKGLYTDTTSSPNQTVDAPKTTSVASRTASVSSRVYRQPKSTITLQARRRQGKENSKVMRIVMDLEEHEYQARRLAAIEDPSIVAMRAAESLDLATANIQPIPQIRREIIRTTYTSMESSIWGLSRNGTQSSKRHSISDGLSTTSRGRPMFKGSLRSRRSRKRVSSLDSGMFILQGQTLGLSASSTALNSPAVFHSQRLIRYSEMTTASLHDDQIGLSVPATPVLFEFGEACMVSVPSLPELDFGNNSKSVDGLFDRYSRPSTASNPTNTMKHAASTMCLRDGAKRFAELKSQSPGSQRGQPRTVTVKPSKRSLNRIVTPPPLPSPAASCETRSSVEKVRPQTSDRACSPIRWDTNPERSGTAMSGDLRLDKPLPEPVSNDDSDRSTSRAGGEKDHIMAAILKGYRGNTFGRCFSPEPREDPEDRAPRPTGRSIFNTAPKDGAKQANLGRMDSTNFKNRRPSDKATFAHYENKPAEERKDSIFTAFSFSPNAERNFCHIATNVHADPLTPELTPPLAAQRRKLSDFKLLPESPTVEARPPSPEKAETSKPWKQFHQIRKLSDFGLLPAAPPVAEAKAAAPALESSQLANFEKFGMIQTGTEKVERYLQSSPDGGYADSRAEASGPGIDELIEDEDRVESDGYLSRRETIDQILAMGCDDGVDQSVWTSAVARVEGMGMLGGGGVVGRLDMQYLMATAMDSVSNTPEPGQSHTASPFASPDKLAALFVQHLERYLKSNQTVRFLIITFPASSLPTIFALRSLLNGSEGAKGVMKVAMVQNGLRPSSPSTGRGSPSLPLLCRLSNEATIALNSRRRLPLAKLGAAKAASLLGNEDVPKPYSHKRQRTVVSRLSEEDGEEVPDFCLNAELSTFGPEAKKALETDMTEFVHGIRRCLAQKNDIYTALEPEVATIANWNAAVVAQSTVQISHSPSSSTESHRRRAKLRKAHPSTSVRPRGKEIFKTVDFEQKSERNESGDWTQLYLALDGVGDGIGAGFEDDKRSFLDLEPVRERPPTRCDQWDLEKDLDLESDDEEDDAGETFICRPENGGVRPKRNMGKALKMLGIA